MLGAFMFGVAMLGLPGCADNDDLVQPPLPEEAEGTIVEVPMNFSIGSAWEIDTDQTRAVPPGLGGNNPGTSTTPDDDLLGYDEIADIDKVQVFTFRRRVRDLAPGATADANDLRFSYDASNSHILDLEEEMIDSGEGRYEYAHKHKHTKDGVLKKVYGYEYKVVALAYSSTHTSAFDKSQLKLESSSQLNCLPGDHNRFSVPVTKNGREIYLDEFEAQINVIAGIGCNASGWQDFFRGGNIGLYKNMTQLGYGNSTPLDIAETPQLFYGHCSAQGVDDDIIRFSESDDDGNDNSLLPVEGILYRGVAKIELHVIPTAPPVLGDRYGVHWIALLSDNIATSVGLTDYDDFLTPTFTLTQGRYRPIGYLHVSSDDRSKTFTSDEVAKMDADTKAKNSKVITAYVLPGKMRLAIRVKTLEWSGTVHSIKNGQLLAKRDVDTPGGNATGIISPDYHDGVFYLRRNHKYVLTVYDTQKVIDNKKNPL